MTDPPDPLRGAGRGLAAASLLVIVLLTLRPAPSYHDLGQVGLCVLCGRYGLANVLRNVLLFVPLGLGLGLGLGGRSFGRAVGAAALLSAGIEAVQLLLPGRNPLPVDFAANSAGGGLGAVLAMAIRARLVLPQSRRARSHAAAWFTAAAGAAALAGSAVAFQLAPPDPPHHVQWTPHLGHLEPYAGTVRDARLGGEALRPGRHPEPALLEERLLGGSLLRVSFTPGPPPARLAPIVSVFTAERREMFLLGARGEDLVLRLPLRASALRLDAPDFRLPSALEQAGDGPLEAFVRVGPKGACVDLGAASRCGLRPTLGEGWSLLLFPGWAVGPVRVAMSLLWLAALAFVPAFLAPSRGAAAVLTFVLVGCAAALPALTASFAWTPPTGLLALGAGGLLGRAATRLLPSLDHGRGEATSVAEPQQARPRHRRGAGTRDTASESPPRPRSGM